MDSPTALRHLTREQQTMLGTLYARALESRSARPLLRDEHAERIVSQLGYDFSQLGVSGTVVTSVALRARQFDRWTATFLAWHPDAIVLHLACGLDARVFRVGAPPTVAWFDVDYPAVIELRRQLLPPRAGNTLIGASVLDADWLASVPRDRPILIVAEGLSMYLPPDAGQRLLVRLVDHCASGGELAFDAQSRLAVRLAVLNPVVRHTGSTLRWGIDDPRFLERVAPRVRLVEVLHAFDLIMGAEDRLPPPYRASLWLMRHVPPLANLGLQLRYSFGPATASGLPS